MAKKFIINNDLLVIGNVGYQFQLVQQHATTRGGGWWHVDRETETLYLYDKSTDYGRCDFNELKKVVENGAMPMSYNKLRIVFSKHERLEDAMKDFIVLKEKSIN